MFSRSQSRLPLRQNACLKRVSAVGIFNFTPCCQIKVWGWCLEVTGQGVRMQQRT